MIWWVLFFVIAALAAYVRLAPNDPARWHVKLEAEAPKDFPGGAFRKLSGGVETLERIDEIALSEPRTVRLAGGPAERITTYMARTALWGFPDYITVWQEGGEVFLWSRLRFGKSDLGVNRKRLERWLAQL